MAFLTIQGYDAPILEGKGRVPRQAHGRSSRGINGTLSQAIYGRTRTVTGTAGLLTEAEATGLVGLLEGRGHLLSFDVDTYTSRAVARASGVGVVSGGELGVSTSYDAWNLGLTGDWTIFGGVRTSGAAVFYSLDSAGTKYKDGAVTADSVSSYLNVVSGQLRLIDGYGGGTTYFPYVAALPFLLSGSQHADITAAGDGAFGALPVLNLSGSQLRGDATTARLDPGSLEEEPVSYGNGSIGWRVSFRLLEVSSYA